MGFFGSLALVQSSEFFCGLGVSEFELCLGFGSKWLRPGATFLACYAHAALSAAMLLLDCVGGFVEIGCAAHAKH